jgi:hypothetical protein
MIVAIIVDSGGMPPVARLSRRHQHDVRDGPVLLLLLLVGGTDPSMSLIAIANMASMIAARRRVSASPSHPANGVKSGGGEHFAWPPPSACRRSSVP